MWRSNYDNRDSCIKEAGHDWFANRLRQGEFLLVRCGGFPGAHSAFFFDLDGCVYTGNERVPGVLEVIELLRSTDRRIYFLTNNSSQSVEEIVEKLHALEVVASPSDVVTAMWALGEHLTERYGKAKILVLGPQPMAEELTKAGHTVLTFEEWGEADAVTVGRDVDISYERLTRACWAVQAGSDLIAANVDPVVPIEDGVLLPGAGPIVRAVEVGTGISAEQIGKPSPVIFQRALKRWGLRPEQTVMVGDRIDSDVAGAKAAGLFSILVSEEIAKDEMQRPDLHVRSMWELLEYAEAALTERET